MGKLSVILVKSLSRVGMHADNQDALYLRISKGGSKSWIQRITINGKRRDVGLGGYPTVSLAQARRLAADNRRDIADGRDPLADKSQPGMPTFAQAAARVIELRRPTWSNPKHAAQWTATTLETYAYPRDRRQGD